MASAYCCDECGKYNKGKPRFVIDSTWRPMNVMMAGEFCSTDCVIVRAMKVRDDDTESQKQWDETIRLQQAHG